MNSLRELWYNIVDKLFLGRVNNKLSNLVDHQFVDQFFYDVAKFVVFNQIEGDYLEFGVLEGDGMASVYHRLHYHWKVYQKHAGLYGHQIDLDYLEKKRLFAFDSFEGLPEVNTAKTPGHFSQAGMYTVPQESFEKSLASKGVDLNKVKIVPGWFNESLTPEVKEKHNLHKACLIFIDCDLYESGVPVFSFITDLIHDGTVVMIDDYFRYKGDPRQGLQKALSEWLDANKHIKLKELTRCSANRLAFVCHMDKKG